ncbi:MULTISPECIES: RNA 2',3'-cyclic phosphodiesterase [Rhodobacterales]|jgi:2'-5' RNA ligase|uniref:RNA 2',3'-cyclic phosphodiesterase n=1 Tax=Rhodobacterales TaxID=204455 RepID=UPI00237F34DA|nr:RNA 2',3'-cyclic phosphodiesterase [Phaeobacter gallaeciensis]MDE4097059.1 RNA 2',3'-cyclic phosphodiesterase [Phaeobacter gallaeciensis]MDE4105648.1 RNA 2',3'-cyclic phosphodiesterase [Phaeobacter gallaeciensis]MDE4110326.1 RNA 2',3'-cyclic phosphodiesterase [Phaeobacter gallaeciensis]MDE4114794.1 RNA 2',3'-cyclic phosphodiesterase [Phaeobacter gallaeciensis]MDE4119039.1 RNA 2',3'-cyclic phosphodiesterase [Phaeobacter gallaeciensis]
MRSFVGLSLPEEAILALETLQEEIPVGRVVPGDNLHLTLAFLDDQPDFALQLLHEELTRIAAVPLRLRITGLDLFGGRVPRILFAAVAPDPDLSRLRDQVRRAAERAEIDLPRERFRPHITLARFPRQMPEHRAQRLGAFLQAQGDFSLPEMQIDRMALFRSTLTPDGARYEVLADYPLEDPAPS